MSVACMQHPDVPIGEHEDALLEESNTDQRHVSAEFSPSERRQPAEVGGDSTAPDRVRRGRVIGCGAFGTVYLGLNVATNQLVAIKQIRLSDARASAVRSIQRELDIMVKLPPHPNCVRYLGHRETDRHISIIMELVSGGSLASLCHSIGCFPESTVRRYAKMTLQGLLHLHRYDVVHQDIKAANVLADSDGVAKIADFGCSRDLHFLTGAIDAAGTPLWMAPEVCAGAPATKSSDIWSFGCFVLEMLKDDHLPWSNLSGGLMAVMYAIGNATRPPPFPERLSPQLCDFLNRCLAIDPQQRHSCAALLTHPWITSEELDLDSFVENIFPSGVQTIASGPSSVFVARRGGSLALDAAEFSESGHGASDALVQIPPPKVDCPSPDSNITAASFTSLTPSPARPLWRTCGQISVGEQSDEVLDTTLLVAVERLAPQELSARVCSKGRRKLGSKGATPCLIC